MKNNVFLSHFLLPFCQSRAVNNWAVLTIGLLNREYKQLEREIELRQQRHLEERQLYLDDQLVYARDSNLRLRRPSGDKATLTRANGAYEEERCAAMREGAHRQSFLTQPPPTPITGQARQVSDLVITLVYV